LTELINENGADTVLNKSDQQNDLKYRQATSEYRSKAALPNGLVGLTSAVDHHISLHHDIAAVQGPHEQCGLS